MLTLYGHAGRMLCYRRRAESKAGRQAGRDAGELTGNQEAIKEGRKGIFILTLLCVSQIVSFICSSALLVQ